MDQKMANAPVYFALARVGYNPIQNLAKYIPEIQDEFRRVGYSRYAEEKNQTVELGIDEDGKTISPTLSEDTVWVFTNPERTSCFVASRSGLAFQTTHYLTRKPFFDSLMLGISLTSKVVNLDYIESIGIRYLDAIIPTEGQGIDSYLVAEVLGLDLEYKKIVKASHSRFEVDLECMAEKAELTVNSHQFMSNISLPPDLDGFELKLMSKFLLEAPCNHAVIDIHSFVESTLSINEVLIVENVLAELHSSMKRAFHTIVTASAIGEWA